MHAMYHTTLGFCWWDIPAVLILLAVVVVLIVRHSKMKKTVKSLEDQLTEAYADAAEKN